MTLDLRSRLVLALAPAVLAGAGLLAAAGFRAGREAVLEQFGREAAAVGRARAEALGERLATDPAAARALAAAAEHASGGGVAEVDEKALTGLARELRALAGTEGATACLANADGLVLAQGPGGRLVVGDLARLFPDAGAPVRADLASRIASPGSDRSEGPDLRTARRAYVIELPLSAFAASGGPRWSLVLAFPTEELIRPLALLRSRVLAAAVVLALALAGLVVAVSSSATRPLRRLAGQARRYAEGRFGDRLDESRGPLETRELSRAFNALGAAILDQMERVRSEAEAKERYRRELEIAADLQRALLPHGFPLFPALAGVFDLFGAVRPAREVGGDLFDAFELPEGRVALVVADVSGKGVPAALFTAQARLVIRFLAAQGCCPGELLGRANAILAREIPSSLFVTVLYVDCDPLSGRLRLASAGHLPPLRIAPGGAVSTIPVKGALPLAAMERTCYATSEATLGEGEALVLHTDGVTDAMDPRDEPFESERLAEVLSIGAGLPCAALAGDVFRAVETFAAGVPQTDDMTILVARRLRR